jgi:predicted nucleotide-binding protein (sugar kinase/HSP70/actin superfamily)
MTQLWTHCPMVSSEPEELVSHFEHKEEDHFFEAAVFKLQDGKYLFISFSKEGDEPESGVTDYEEFDNLQEAVRIFKEMTE